MSNGWVEKFNQAVRGFLTLGLGAGFIWLAFIKEVGGDVYTNVFLVVIGFWFGSRGAPPAPLPGPQDDAVVKVAAVAAKTALDMGVAAKSEPKTGGTP